jgi:hypothetical protein
MKTMTVNERIPVETAAAALKAVIIYDDFKLAARANSLLEHIRARSASAEDVRWEVGPWRLQVLQHPNFAADALVEAADADLILLALGGGDRVQEDVLAWLEIWALRRNHPDAAVMFFCPDDGVATTRLVSELKWFTVRQGLTFLDSHVGWAPGPVRARRPWYDASPFGLGMDALIPWIWGVNE